jgi:hypothetical protein
MYDGTTPPPKVFVCCQSCREHPTGSACNHASIEGLEFSDALAFPLLRHDGCTCTWAEKVAGAGPNPKLVTG